MRRAGKPQTHHVGESAIMSRRVRSLVLFIIATAVVAFTVRIIYAKKLDVPQSTGEDSYGKEPRTHTLLADVLEELGYHVLQNRSARIETISSTLLMLEPNLNTTFAGRELELTNILNAREADSLRTIVALPKWHDWSAAESSYDSEGVTTDGYAELPESSKAYQVLDAVLTNEAEPVAIAEFTPADRIKIMTAEGPLGRFDVVLPKLRLALVETSRSLLHVRTNHDVPGMRWSLMFTSSSTVVLVDADMIHSFNLQRGGHAMAFAALLDTMPGDTVVFDEALHGHGRLLSLADGLGSFPGILLFVHGMLLCGVLIWAGARRFGKPKPRQALGGTRGALAGVDVAASVLANGRPLHQLVHAYVSHTLAEISAQLATANQPNSTDLSTLDALAKRLKLTDSASKLVHDARDAETSRSNRKAANLVERVNLFFDACTQPRSKHGKAS